MQLKVELVNTPNGPGQELGENILECLFKYLGSQEMIKEKDEDGRFHLNMTLTVPNLYDWYKKLHGVCQGDGNWPVSLTRPAA